jgi:hypothetical protein
MDALERANEVRLARPALRREVGDGVLSLADALLDPRAASMTVYDLLVCQHRCGPGRAGKALQGAAEELWQACEGPFTATRLVGDLTERERAALVQACSPKREAA